MIEETLVEIGQAEQASAVELQERHARRNQIRHIDNLLEEFEVLNLAEESEVPTDLRVRVSTLVCATSHPLASQPSEYVSIFDWMEALYDIQDTLMIPFEETD